MPKSNQQWDPVTQYHAIEAAYRREQWSTVLKDGHSLLRLLPRSGEANIEDLKQRLQVLMAHAYLYGRQNREIAAEIYSNVLASRADTALRQIAEQGLMQCQQAGSNQEQAVGHDRGLIDTTSSNLAGSTNNVGTFEQIAPTIGTKHADKQQPATPWLASNPTSGTENGNVQTAFVQAATTSAAMPWTSEPTGTVNQKVGSGSDQKDTELAGADLLMPDLAEEPEQLIEVHQQDSLSLDTDLTQGLLRVEIS